MSKKPPAKPGTTDLERRVEILEGVVLNFLQGLFGPLQGSTLEISQRLQRIENGVTALHTLATASAAREASMNDRLSELQQALDALNTVTNDLSTKVDKVVTNETAQLELIQSLRDQVAAGTPVSPTQLDALVAQAQGTVGTLTLVRDHLAVIAADPDNPAPPVPVDGGVNGNPAEV